MARLLRCAALLLCLPLTPLAAQEWTQELEADTVVTCLAEGAGLWAGDAAGRVWSLGPNQPMLAHERAGHPVTALWADEDGTLWVGWDDGISRMTPENPPKWEFWDRAHLKMPGFLGARMWTDDPGLPMGPVDCIVRTSKGLQVAPRDHGLLLCDEAAGMFEPFWAHCWGPNSAWLTLSDMLPSKRVLCALEDPFGNAWFGTTNGVVLVDKGEMLRARRRSGYYSRLDEHERPPPPGVRFTAESHGLASNEVTAMAVDAEGAVWFGFGGGGGVARRSRGGEWGVKEAGPVTALAGDGDGRMWVGTAASLTAHDGDERRAVPGPGEWRDVSDLLCTRDGRMLVAAESRVWSTPVTPMPEEWPMEVTGPLAPPEDSDEPVELPPAAAAEAPVGALGPEAILSVVVERNRAWLLPPGEEVRSLEYLWTLEEPGIQQRVRWEAPYNCTVELTWDRDDLAPDLVGRRWVSFDDNVWEQTPTGAQPLSPERHHAGRFWQDITTGSELQTVLRAYARQPETLVVGRSGHEGINPGDIVIAIRPPEDRRAPAPFAAARLFWLAWDYGISTSHIWHAEISIDPKRIVPTGERWYYEDKALWKVIYDDFRETPDGPAPLRVAVKGQTRWEAVAGLEARYAWFEPGAWVMQECVTDIEDHAGQHHSRATVSGVRVNRELRLAEELEAVGEDVAGRRHKTLDILEQVAEQCQPWLGEELDPAFMEVSYRFELIDKDGTPRGITNVSVTAGETSRWSPRVVGNTLGVPLASLVAEPELYDLLLTGEREHEGRRVLTLQANSDERVRVPPVGNGMGPTWYGYGTQAWRKLEVWVDAETLLPVKAQAGNRAQWYRDYEEVQPGKFAPMKIDLAGWLEYHFAWVGDCLWLATETISSPNDNPPHRRSRVTNLRVNDEPVEGIPELTDAEIAAARAAMAKADEEERQREREEEEREREEEDREMRDR